MGRRRKRREELWLSLRECQRRVLDVKLRERLRRAEVRFMENKTFKIDRDAEGKVLALLNEFPAIAARGLKDVTGHYLNEIEEKLRMTGLSEKRGLKMSFLNRFRDAGKGRTLEAKSRQTDAQLRELEVRIGAKSKEYEDLCVRLSVIKHDAAKLDRDSQEYQNLRMKALMMADKVKTEAALIEKYRSTLLSNHRYQEMMRQGIANLDLKKYAMDIPDLQVTIEDIVEADAELKTRTGDIGGILTEGARALKEESAPEPAFAQEALLFDREIEEMLTRDRAGAPLKVAAIAAPAEEEHFDLEIDEMRARREEKTSEVGDAEEDVGYEVV